MHEPWRIVMRTVPNDEHENRQCDRPNQTKANRKLVPCFSRAVNPVSSRTEVGRPNSDAAAQLFLVNAKASACHDGEAIAALLNEPNDDTLG
jgi:hypothetical protein